jgi:tetratricopeptide (TPR) repeat protein
MPGDVTDLAVARYLRPEKQVVPFRPRPELAELLDWCVNGGHAGVRLVTGDGGAGKTRLALQLVKELAAAGWQPLWVPRGSERDAVDEVRVLDQPYVLIVDYAETHGELSALANAAALDRDGPDLRVLLLARSAGEWWQQLAASAEEPAAALLEAAAPLTLGPLPAPGGPHEVFDEALKVFARRLGVSTPAVRLGLADPDPVVLVVHAAALLAVADHAAGVKAQQAASGSQVLQGLLRHEARYWAQSAAARGLSLDLPVLRLAVAVACLMGADSETSAAALLACVPDLDSAERRGQVARWLHDLYPTTPGDQGSDREWLGSLRPDRLAEQLVTGELARRPELIPRLFTELSETLATRALTVLARAALAQDDAAGLLGQALASDLEHLAVSALSVAVETNPLVGTLLSEALEERPIAGETLARVAAACPYPSFAVAAPAAIVLGRLAEGTADDSERAGWLVELSIRLADLGRREEALAAIEQATGIYRQLAEDRPDAFLPDLAMSLNNRAGCLADVGRREEALAVIEQATGIYRQLAEDRPDAFLPDLATSLRVLAHVLHVLGRNPEAMEAQAEADAFSG